MCYTKVTITPTLLLDFFCLIAENAVSITSKRHSITIERPVTSSHSISSVMNYHSVPSNLPFQPKLMPQPNHVPSLHLPGPTIVGNTDENPYFPREDLLLMLRYASDALLLSQSLPVKSGYSSVFSAPAVLCSFLDPKMQTRLADDCCIETLTKYPNFCEN